MDLFQFAHQFDLAVEHRYGRKRSSFSKQAQSAMDQAIAEAVASETPLYLCVDLIYNLGKAQDTREQEEIALRKAIAAIIKSAEDKSEAVAMLCHAAYAEGLSFDLISNVAFDLHMEPENHTKETV